MDLDPTLLGGLELGLKICPVKTSTCMNLPPELTEYFNGVGTRVGTSWLYGVDTAYLKKLLKQYR